MKLIGTAKQAMRTLPSSIVSELDAELNAQQSKEVADILDEVAIEVQTTAPDAAPLSLEKRYSILLTAFAKLTRKVQLLEHPVRSPEKHDIDLHHVQMFMNSMSNAEGAVTCANLYTKQVLELDGDRRYVVDLCTMLVNRYASVSSLIESTFKVWKTYAN